VKLDCRSRFDGWLSFTGFFSALFSIPFLTLLGVALSSGLLWQGTLQLLPVYLQNTFVLMLGVGIGTLIFGITTGWVVSMYHFPGRRFFEWALLLPLSFPGYILAMVYVDFFEFSGPVQSTLRSIFQWKTPHDYWFPQIVSLEGAIFVLSLVLYPYVYLLARTAFLKQSHGLLEASRMLGKGNITTFFQIVLPLARPALIIGLSLVLMEAAGDFGTVQLFAVPTFTTGIYKTWFQHYDMVGATQLSLILLGIVGGLLWLERYSRRQQRFQYRSLSRGTKNRPHLKGIKALFCLLMCLFPLSFGFFLPASILVQWVWQDWALFTWELFISDVWNSVLLAVSVAGLAIILGLFLGYGVRLSHSTWVESITRLATLGYAMPGPVVALGVLLPFSWIDQNLNSWLNLNSSYLLSGGIFILLFAYMMRFLTLSYGNVESGLHKITNSLDEVSQTLGKTPLQTLKRVHFPMLRGSLLTGGLLVFVEVMKELPITLMLQPFNFSTLATRTYSYASEELIHEAGLWALAIVVTGLFPVIILGRQIGQSDY